MTDCVVDSGSTRTNLALTVSTKDQVVGPDGTCVVGLDREQLLQAVGCKTADLLNVKQIVCRPLEFSNATDAHYGVTIGHNNEVGMPNSIKTSSRSVNLDGDKNVASSYHYVHTTGAAFGDHVLEVNEKAHEDPSMAFKTALRWRANQTDTSGPFDLMTADSVNHGVVKSEANGQVKYLICPEDANGPSAMWRLIEHNKNSKFCGGRYSDKNRKEVNYNGKQAIVMSETDFDALSTQLKESLATTSDFNDGLFAHCMLIKGQPPESLTIPLVIEREPRELEGHSGGVVTMTDLSEHLAGSGLASSKTPLTKAIFSDAAEGTVATFTPLTEPE